MSDARTRLQALLTSTPGAAEVTVPALDLRAVLREVVQADELRTRFAELSDLRDRDLGVRAEVVDVTGRLRSAQQLLDVAQARVVELLAELDRADPDGAKRYRTAWGLWP